MARALIGFHKNRKVSYELNDLTRHALVVGTTGSGKTVMCKVLVEEALSKGIPVIAVDPKGDIGGLAVTDKDFDFRPFGGKGKAKAEKTASKYEELLEGVDTKNAEQLRKVKTHVYTPKSNVGLQLSFMPSLSAPKNFSKLEEDHSVIAGFVEPVSESLLQLAGITGKSKDKAQSLVSSILIDKWSKGKDLSIESLVSLILNPPFETIGSLPLDDFMNEKERKKLASSLNLLLSAPSKKAWSHGESLDVKGMLKPYSLSVFDLRFTGTNQEKQFAVEILLQEVYKYLVSRGGSERLKFVLYIDEIAGFIPPPPSNPAIKKTLELLVRQARAFGLGIILATQSPGDVDYKLFGNLGTRFIGKLRTEQDMEKVAVGAGLPVSLVRKEVSGLGTGEFYYNNSVKNKNLSVKARWVFSYHAGPLSIDEIKWVNNPSLKPFREPISISRKKALSKKKSRKPEFVSGASIVSSVKKKSAKKKKKKPEEKTRIESNVLSSLVKSVKNLSDNVQLKAATQASGVLIPHLRIVIEPKQVRGVNLEMKGPYIFDLSSKAIPIGNYLKNITWSQYIPKQVVVEKPKRSVKQSIEYALKDAKQRLKKKYYASTIISAVSEDFDRVVSRNKEFLSDHVKASHDSLDRKLASSKKPLEERIRTNKKKSNSLRLKLARHKTSRAFKKIISGKRLSKSTKELDYWSKRIKKLEKENKRLKARIDSLSRKHSEKKRRVEDTYFEKARRSVKTKSFKPSNKDLVVHTTILLVPARKTRA